MSTANEKRNEKENMEEQITNMLEKVLSDEFEDEEVGDRTMYTNLTSTEQEEMTSFFYEENLRRNKKAFSSKPKINQRMNIEMKEEEDTNEISPRGRNEKKSRTYAYNQTPQLDMQMMLMQQYPELNQNYMFDPKDLMRIQKQMMNLNIGMNSQSQTQHSGPNIEEYVESVLKNHDKLEEGAYLRMKGLFLKIIMTQNGSRFLQKAIKKTNKEILSLILDEILCQINGLIMDPYANYFCQKFFISLKTSDRVRLLKKISPCMLEISKDKIGTYPLQAFIEQLNSIEEKKIVIEALGEHIYDLCFDSQGVHVVEKIIICFEEELILFIYEMILRNFMTLANNCNGLCAVKKAITHCMNPLIISQLMKKILDNCLILVQNPFGNYAIQVALDHWRLDYILPIIKIFYSKFGNLSMQKYSSNVIEKCLEKGGEAVLNAFIDEITYNNRVADLMKNNYGNYVVQKALRLATGNYKLKLVTSVLKSIEKLGDRKLMVKWKSIVDNSIGIDMGIEHNFPTFGDENSQSRDISIFNQNLSDFSTPFNDPFRRKNLRSQTTQVNNPFQMGNQMGDFSNLNCNNNFMYNNPNMGMNSIPISNLTNNFYNIGGGNSNMPNGNSNVFNIMNNFGTTNMSISYNNGFANPRRTLKKNMK